MEFLAQYGVNLRATFEENLMPGQVSRSPGRATGLTVSDICNRAFALMFETASGAPEYVESAPAVLGTLVPELFDLNNDLRMWKGLEPLTEWPEFQTSKDDIVFEPELCRAALPYGLAAGLFLGDEEDGRFGSYSIKYAEAVNACMKLHPQGIVDVYGGEAV